MKYIRIAASIASGTAVVGLACGTAHASSDQADAALPAEPGTSLHTNLAPGVDYTGNAGDSSVFVSTPFGSLTTRGTEFQVLDQRGDVVAGQPLTHGTDPAQWPMAARPHESTPASWAAPQQNTDADPGGTSTTAAPAPNRQIDASADFNAALGQAAVQFGLATGVGTLAGGVVGMGLGCVGGALTGGFLAIPTGPIAAPAAALGCIMGASLGAGIGGVTGAALLGIPVGVASAVQMYNSLHAAGDI
jgi:hypothetical protein